jgi:hypothetical protein
MSNANGHMVPECSYSRLEPIQCTNYQWFYALSVLTKLWSQDCVDLLFAQARYAFVCLPIVSRAHLRQQSITLINLIPWLQRSGLCYTCRWFSHVTLRHISLLAFQVSELFIKYHVVLDILIAYRKLLFYSRSWNAKSKFLSQDLLHLTNKTYWLRHLFPMHLDMILVVLHQTCTNAMCSVY